MNQQPQFFENPLAIPYNVAIGDCNTTTEFYGKSFSETASTGIFKKVNISNSSYVREKNDTKSPSFSNASELFEYVKSKQTNNVLIFPVKENSSNIEVDLLGKTFVPSETLVNYFKHGIEAARELVEQSIDFDDGMYAGTKHLELKSTEELKEVLQRKIIQAFALYASGGIAKGLAELAISKDMGFTVAVQDMISKEILISHADLSYFLECLLGELRFHILHNGRVSGSWGKMIMRGSDMLLSLNTESTPIYPPKEKARLIKIK